MRPPTYPGAEPIIWFCDNCDEYTEWRPFVGCLECDARDRADSARTEKVLDQIEREGLSVVTAGKSDG